MPKHVFKPVCALAVLIAGVMATPLPVMAQDAGRFTIERSGEGEYLRMDTQTGEMSVCTMREGQVICRMAADQRMAFQDELDRLEQRIAALEAGQGMAPAANRSNGDLPSEEEFERTLGYMERFMRTFMGIVDDFQGDEPANPQAN